MTQNQESPNENSPKKLNLQNPDIQEILKYEASKCSDITAKFTSDWITKSVEKDFLFSYRCKKSVIEYKQKIYGIRSYFIIPTMNNKIVPFEQVKNTPGNTLEKHIDQIIKNHLKLERGQYNANISMVVPSIIIPSEFINEIYKMITENKEIYF